MSTIQLHASIGTTCSKGQPSHDDEIDESSTSPMSVFLFRGFLTHHLQLECCGSAGPLDWVLSVHNGYTLNTKVAPPNSYHDLAHSCTRFPCYLGMEIQTINAKTQWITTKIVELGNQLITIRTGNQCIDNCPLSIISRDCFQEIGIGGPASLSLPFTIPPSCCRVSSHYAIFFKSFHHRQIVDSRAVLTTVNKQFSAFSSPRTLQTLSALALCCLV